MFDLTGSHSRDYENYNLLGGYTMCSDLNSLAFNRDIIPPSSRSKNKPCKKPASRALSW